MWKKDEGEEAPRQSPPRTDRGGGASPPRQATIGGSITIRGEVTGNEDLLIEGTVDGSVDLGEHQVTIGEDGDVKASITARAIIVQGSVTGDLAAEERVVLRSSAQVEGDITAPRVVLDDGARFRGGVDMGRATGRGRDAEAKPDTGGASSRTALPPSGGSKRKGGEQDDAPTADGAPAAARQ